MIGEPDAGNPQVRFDEGVQETCDTRGAPAPYSTRGAALVPASAHSGPGARTALLTQVESRVPKKVYFRVANREQSVRLRLRHLHGSFYVRLTPMVLHCRTQREL
jgi:hypothetical protein